MHKYSTVRVGVAGVTGYAGLELLRRLARHPQADVRYAMASSASESKRMPAWRRIWDAPVEPLDVESWRGDGCGVPGAARHPRGGARAGARRPEARGCSISLAHFGSRRRAAAEVVSRIRRRSVPAVYGLTERCREELADARLIACRRLLSDGRDPCARSRSSPRPARAGHHHRREVRGFGRRQDADASGRTFPRSTAASRPTACSRIVTPPKSSRRIGVPVTFVPHLVPLDRGILETIYARLRSRASTKRTVASALTRGVRRRSVRPIDRQPNCRRSSTSRTRTSATSAGGSQGQQLVMVGVHRQPREGGGRPGDPELQRVFGFDGNGGTECDREPVRRCSKLGGELLEDGGARCAARRRRSCALAANRPLIIVHGGGRAIDAELRARGLEPRFVDGLRITDAGGARRCRVGARGTQQHGLGRGDLARPAAGRSA